jgi:c-di-GMP-related signal transduction protein
MMTATANPWDVGKVSLTPGGASDLLCYTARQPILDREGRIFGYELLFRDGLSNYCSSLDLNAAARATLDASVVEGLDVLCDGKLAFINCTRDVLVNDYATLLPAHQCVIEILESVAPEPEVIAAVRRLRDAGYKLALDDFTASDPREALVDLVDIVKVDLLLTTVEERGEIVRRLGSRARILAEKVSTRDEFLMSRAQGFELFQGFFFRVPEVIATREIPANSVNYMRLLQAASRADLNWTELEEILKTEAALCYRLLRFLNSPLFAFKNEIGSIHQALVLLGERETRRWIRLAATVSVARRKPGDLLLATLTRARFCELLAPVVKVKDADLFLVGLFSLMDSILDQPMSVLVEKVPLTKDARAVLLGEPSPLTPVYRLMLANEAGEWGEIRDLCSQLGINENVVAECNWSALQWAHHMAHGL